MNGLRTGNKQLLRDLNKTLVLNEIRKRGPISRTEISQNTSLSLSSITRIADELIEQGFIYEQGEGESTGGRKPIHLLFNSNYGYIIGIKIEVKQAIFTLSNLNGEIIKKIMRSYPRGSSYEVVMDIILDELNTLISRCEAKDKKLLGVGIAVSGLVDTETGVLISSSLLGWSNVSFKSNIQSVINIPVIVDNDVNAYTLAEMMYGAGRNLDNFLLIEWGIGIGSGIVLDGKIYRGDFGGAGEVGHIILEKDGEPCYCGQRGCLERYANEEFIVNRALKLAKENLDSKLSNRDMVGIADVREAARRGDTAARRAYAEAAHNLGLGLASVVNLFNISTIILSGEAAEAEELVFPQILESVQNSFFSKYIDIKVKKSQLGNIGWELGTGALVLKELFQTPIYKNQLTLHAL